MCQVEVYFLAPQQSDYRHERVLFPAAVTHLGQVAAPAQAAALLTATGKNQGATSAEKPWEEGK